MSTDDHRLLTKSIIKRRTNIMESVIKKETTKNSENDNINFSSSIQEYEWDESKATTKTTWDWCQNGSRNRNRNKRVYGKTKPISNSHTASAVASTNLNHLHHDTMSENDTKTEAIVGIESNIDDKKACTISSHKSLHQNNEFPPTTNKISETTNENTHPNVREKRAPPKLIHNPKIIRRSTTDPFADISSTHTTSSQTRSFSCSMPSQDYLKDVRYYKRTSSFSVLSSFSSSSTSFSSLSRDCDLAPTWMDTKSNQNILPNNDILIPILSTNENVSSTIDVTDLDVVATCLTPTRSVCSNRKRGVCCSPYCDDDESQSHGGISNSQISTSSFGSRRARSRIFSPSTTKTITQGILPSSSSKREVVESFIASDSDSDEETHQLDNSVSMMQDVLDDIHVDSMPKIIENEIVKPPAALTRISSIDDASFDKVVFGFVDKSIKTKNDQNFQSVFDTMSSYEDLKYLLKELRRWNSNQHFTSFGMTNNCSIVLPFAWSSDRKTAFISWTTNHFGFSLRSGGGNVSYLQTNLSRGSAVKEQLEKAMLKYKAENKAPKIQDNISMKGVERCTVSEFIPTENNSDNMKAPFSSIKILHNNIGSPLFDLSSIPIRSSSKNTPMSIERQVMKDNSHDIEDTFLNNFTSLSIGGKCSDSVHIDDGVTPMKSSDQDYSINEDTSLVRMVTLQPDDDHVSHVAANANHRLPRHSYENPMMDARDLVSHLQGVSPMHHVHQNIRPRNLKLPRPRLKENICALSPCVQTISATLSFEKIETPMPKLGDTIWGSRPIPGKDWGVSERCRDEDLIYFKMLIDRGNNNVNYRFLSEISAIVADSKALGLDIEAELSNQQCCDIETIANKESHQPSIFQDLQFPEKDSSPTKKQKRRLTSIAKHHRMSICETALGVKRPPRLSTIHVKPFSKLQTFSSPIAAKSFIMENLEFNQIETFRQKVSSPSYTKLKEDVFMPEGPIMSNILSFLGEQDLLRSSFLVCSKWADSSTDALVSLMLFSVGCSTEFIYGNRSSVISDDTSSDNEDNFKVLASNNSLMKSMERPWIDVHTKFPWGQFLSEGTFKQVYKVWNSSTQTNEAISVMDVNKIDNKNVVGSELAVSVLLSSLVRRNVCPNFVVTRSVFTSAFAPSSTRWGSASNKRPNKRQIRLTNPPDEEKGLFQYIRMELCQHGDVEDFIRKQPGGILDPEESRNLLFQMAFSLHVISDRYGLKHYDVKLLNFFLQSSIDPDVHEELHPFTILRYGVGSRVFRIKMKTSRVLIAKLADYGTADMRPESNGNPVILSNFTTIENTPPDYLILGDSAKQGYGHDSFGLGLCMLHLFTGHAPYEEIMDSVRCPPQLKKKLKQIWQSCNSNGYEVIRSVILSDVYEDEEGFIHGEPDEVLYDTLYRFLVLFGIPEEKFQKKDRERVWKAISSCLEGRNNVKSTSTRPTRHNASATLANDVCPDAAQYRLDCSKFSFLHGSDSRISNARKTLEKMPGGIELLFSLVSFDPDKRATALNVINSEFMSALREENCGDYSDDSRNIVRSYMAYAQ